MNKPSKLAVGLAGTLIVASLLGTSAFAESRHHERTDSGQRQGSARQENRSQGWTRGNQGGRGYDRGGSRPTQSYDRQRAGGWNRGSVQAPQAVQPQRGQYNNPQRGQYTNPQRGQYNNPQRGQYTYPQRGQYNQQQFNNRGPRYDNRGYGNRGGQQYSYRGTQRGSYGHYSYPSRGGRAGMVMQGRISRINHERGGYRVWLDRGRYSYWVPDARFRLWPLRVGLSIRFGGWWNPLGYYDVYDMGPLSGPFYTSGDLHGVVESVDYARGTVVLRDDLSGSFVTAVLRGGDPRLGDLRPGDYVDLSGAWTRGGYFDAYQLQNIQNGGYNGGYVGGYDDDDGPGY